MRYVRERISSINKFKGMVEVEMRVMNFLLKFVMLAKSEKNLDTTKRFMSSPKCRSIEVINNPAGPGSNHKEVNYINYK